MKLHLDMHDYPPAARMLWFTVAGAGAVAIAYAGWRLLMQPPERIAFALSVIVAVALVAAFPVKVPGTRMALACADIFTMLLLLHGNVPAAMLANATEGAVASARMSKRWTSRLGTPALAALVMLACGEVLDHIRPEAERAYGVAGLIAAATLVGLFDFVAATGFARVLFALKGRAPIRPLTWWREDYLIGLWYVTSASVAALIYLAVQHFGWATLFVAIPVILLFVTTYLAMARADTISRRKSEFLARMSHELRTPLNAIIGGSEVLKDGVAGPLSPKQSQWASDIHDSGNHLLGVINEILDISKIEAGRMDLERKLVEVGAIVAGATSLVKDAATRRNIELNSAVAADAGVIAADERKLKQVLLNLLSNAIKFTPEGGRVDVIARRVPHAVEISVRDSGIGIAPEDREAVFDPFRQVGNDAVAKARGTGLGLTLARDLAVLHGGTLTLESEPGRGSVFTVRLPA